MELNARIYVAGHRGLAGSALARRLKSGGFRNLLTRTHAELELTDQTAVRNFFEREKPAYVFLAAAKVGGILANKNYPAEFIQSNLSVQTNVMHEAWRNGVRRLLFLGSSCIYPRDCPQPIKEEYLLTGPLEFTNRAYAVAKIAGVEMCRSYNRQYGTRFLAAMPTNLYGPNDNYDPEGALYSDDMADACVMMMNLPDEAFDQVLSGPNDFPLVNVGCGEDQSIADLARAVAAVVGFRGALEFDASKPDGTPRKLLDIGRLRKLGWSPGIDLKAGITAAYKDFLAQEGGLSEHRGAMSRAKP